MKIPQYTITNTNNDLRTIFIVSFELGGFRKYMNSNITTQKSKSMLQPINKA